MRRVSAAWCVLPAACSVLVTAVAILQAQQMPEQVKARLAAFVTALSNGSPEQFEAMAQEHYAPGLLSARSADDRKAMVQRVHGDFGELTVESEIVTAPGKVELQVRSTRGPSLRLLFEFQPSDPYKIVRIGLQADTDAGGRGGPGREGGSPGLQPPAITPSMKPAELSRSLDAYLSKLAASDEFAGVVVVARNGQVVFENGYGIADRARKTPITPALRFNIASIGKAFTKVAIGQLVSAGRLSLPETLGRVLPDYPNAQARPATIDQLLNHTAGIADFFGPRFEAAPKAQFKSNADYFRFVSGEPLLFPPGTRNEYCNGCYIVLGQVIEKVAGVPYERYIEEHIFKPAGMTGAGFLAYGDPGVAPGYARTDGKLVPNDATQGRHGSAAGGAFARAADLLAFDNALRERKLLDARMTAWYLGGAAVTSGRAPGDYGIAGGTRGANAGVEANGEWTVVVTGNLDPPNAVRVATAIMRQLRQL